MSELLSEEERQTLAQVAEYTHRMNEEAARANRERESLKQADDATVRAILSDRARPTLSRGNALLLLIGRDHLHRDRTLSGIILPLWDDPDMELANETWVRLGLWFSSRALARG